MRLSDFAPRINGIVPVATRGMRGIGLGTAIDPATLIATDLQSYLSGLNYDMEQGIAKTPAQFQSVLQQEVAAACTNWTTACGDYSSLIANAVAQYTSAYQAEYTKVTQEIAAGSISVPSTYVAPVPAPNALNVVAPTQTAVQTAQSGRTALYPPTVTYPPVTTQQVVNNQTQGGSMALANGTSGSNVNTGTGTGTGSWLTTPISTSIPIPMWVALAGGAVALFMVMKK